MLGAIGLLLALLLALGVGFFGFMNLEPVPVQIWPGIRRSAFIWEIAVYAAMAGTLTSMLFLLGGWLGVHRRCRRLRRRVLELERQLQQSQPVVGEAPLTALDNGTETTLQPHDAGRSGILSRRRGAAVEAGRADSRSDEEPV
jgi:hypothetical protein